MGLESNVLLLFGTVLLLITSSFCIDDAAKDESHPMLSRPDPLCGVRGYLTKIDPTWANSTSYASNFDKCRHLCFRHFGVYRASCNTFGFDYKTSTCTLTNAHLIDAGFVEDQWASNWSEVYCYPDAIIGCIEGSNLLDNGGFDGLGIAGSPEHIGPWIDIPKFSDAERPYALVSPGYYSPRAFYCAPNALSQCVLEQTFINACGARYFFISFDYKFEPVAYYTPLIDARFNEQSKAGGRYVLNITSNTTINWTTTQMYLNNIWRGNIYLRLSPGMYIDNVRVIPAWLPSIEQGPENLLVNGDFQTGLLSPWHEAPTPSRLYHEVVSTCISRLDHCYKISNNVIGSPERAEEMQHIIRSASIAETVHVSLSQSIPTKVDTVYQWNMLVNPIKPTEIINITIEFSGGGQWQYFEMPLPGDPHFWGASLETPFVALTNVTLVNINILLPDKHTLEIGPIQVIEGER